ncbi:MAG: MMPL family transporter [Solirubrobacteraceae bacterium]
MLDIPTSSGHRRHRPVASGRSGRALRWLRWPVVIVWVLAIVLLHPLAGSLYEVTNDTAAANLPSSAPSTRVVTIQDAAQRSSSRQVQSDTVAVVIARAEGIAAGVLAASREARAAVGRLVGRVDGLGAPGALRRAPDGQTEVFTADVTAPALNATSTDTHAVQAVRRAVALATRGLDDGLQVAVTGQAAITADTGNTSQNALLVTALVIVAVVLLLVYRSIVLWVFPLLGALAGIVVAQAATHGLGSAGVTVSSLSSSILIVLAFGAASDYAVLLIHRYRAELRHHPAAEDAMAAALRRTLPTLAASAATVVGAMLCLLAAESASLHGLGPVGAVAIASALLAQTTFLPAMLLVFGRAAFWPRPPRAGDTRDEGSPVWSSIGTRVANHPGRVALVAVVLLGAACVGLVTLRVDNNPLANLKGKPESVEGAQVVAEHFGPGAIAPLVLLAPPREASAAAATARSIPSVTSVAREPSVRGYANYSVTLSVDPYGAKGSTAVANLRARLDRHAPGSLVGGDPAVQYDITQAAGHDALVLIPLVLVVICAVVAVLLQALVAPLILVATTALSFGASFGLANVLWRYGLGYPGVEAQLPLYVFVFLVALGVDYNIFLAARIREESRQIDTRHATIRGLAVTGGVITAAGVILAGTFGALAGRPLVNITEVGTAIAIGVLLDTLLVRTVLVPGAFLIIGERVWWPKRPGKRHPPTVGGLRPS